MEDSKNSVDLSSASESQNEEKKSDKKISDIDKVLGYNKLGSLLLAADRFEQSIQIYLKGVELYEKINETKPFSFMFFGNLYSNLAKAYSCVKQLDTAAVYYRKCIDSHPLLKLMLKQKEFFKQHFKLDLENDLLEDNEKINDEELKLKHGILLKFFSDRNAILIKEEEKDNQNNLCNLLQTQIIDNYKPNLFNNLSAFCDSLVNLAVIYQSRYSTSISVFNMYYISVLLEPNNDVANIDYNNFLRECNNKILSDDFIRKRIYYDKFLEKKNGKIIEEDKNDFCFIDSLNANPYVNNESQREISFVCMKWGSKYDSEYVNKLYRGIKRNTNKKFDFFCITEDKSYLDAEIKTLDLDMSFTGWMRKSILFNYEYTKNFARKICFIDLDMIICGNIDFLIDYDNDFCLMKTDDIQCEASKDGYNSSIILWRNGFGRIIFDYMKKYHKQITHQIVRFDHYLEYIVKNSQFVQDEFQGKVLDYNTYCKAKDKLPENAAIIAFPRNPKPHDCKEKWVEEHWI